MNLVVALLVGLTVLGSISPLLTFASLFQLKEWRIDRLREHLRREGYLSLVGSTRPTLLLLYAIGVLLFGQMAGTATFIIFWLALFAGLSITQLTTGKQPMPTWTNKARILVGGSVLLTTACSVLLLRAPYNLPIIPLLQPLIVLIAWAGFYPIDQAMKKRIMMQATQKRQAMGDITVIGIAGSVGKTTTKNLIATLLQDLRPAVTPEHVNTEMGVAQWLLGLDEHSSILVIEMGAYAKGEIALLGKIAMPTIGVITALGGDHIGLFGSEKKIVEANAELIDALPHDGHLFLDGTNESTAKLASRASCPTTATEQASNIDENPEGIELKIQDTRYKIRIHGAHNSANIALAIAVAKHLGITDERITELLTTYKATDHTFNVRTESGITILDDTYNISVLSLRAALDWATKHTAPRTLLTSGLLELGKDEKVILTELGTYAKNKVNRVIFTTESGRIAFEKGYGKPVELLSNTTERVPTNSTLLCVGRMPQATINQLLPKS